MSSFPIYIDGHISADLNCLILSSLPAFDLNRIILLSKDLQAFMLKHDAKLWRELLEQNFPELINQTLRVSASLNWRDIYIRALKTAIPVVLRIDFVMNVRYLLPAINLSNYKILNVTSPSHVPFPDYRNYIIRCLVNSLSLRGFLLLESSNHITQLVPSEPNKYFISAFAGPSILQYNPAVFGGSKLNFIIHVTPDYTIDIIITV